MRDPLKFMDPIKPWEIIAFVVVIAAVIVIIVKLFYKC